jgi:hypothetical protein
MTSLAIAFIGIGGDVRLINGDRNDLDQGIGQGCLELRPSLVPRESATIVSST